MGIDEILRGLELQTGIKLMEHLKANQAHSFAGEVFIIEKVDKCKLTIDKNNLDIEKVFSGDIFECDFYAKMRVQHPKGYGIRQLWISSQLQNVIAQYIKEHRIFEIKSIGHMTISSISPT